MDHQSTARALVAERFPGAVAAVLAGSTVNGVPTVTSDLDIVVVLDGPPAPYRETIRAAGRPVELFVHTEDSLAYWYARDASDGHCTLAHMMATGAALTDDDRVSDLQASARRHVAAGPPVWTDAELAYRRYALTDALDDLAGATDQDERDVLASQITAMAAELALHTRGAWLGRGKWLVRQLRTSDARLCTDLMAAHRAAVSDGNTVPLTVICDRLLDEVGGRLTEGFSAR